VADSRATAKAPRRDVARDLPTCLKSAEGFLEKVLVLEQDLLDSAATL
jgi:hypothetical protein